tara:strand:- start:1401 stop:1928 length:528 start_codon:yes stop_codon:yes gene_type:complete
MNFCPNCGKRLGTVFLSGKERMACPDIQCGFVNWTNPIPVAAAVVECTGSVLLVQNVGWPNNWYGLVTGFVESGEMPEEAVVREVKEEIGLDAEMQSFIGMYEFHRKNELIIAYHVTVPTLEYTLDKNEIADAKWIEMNRVEPWNAGTGLALRDWLKSRGLSRSLVEIGTANSGV